jgi:hypothetical protein
MQRQPETEQPNTRLPLAQTSDLSAKINQRAGQHVTAMSVDCHFLAVDFEHDVQPVHEPASLTFVAQGEADKGLLFEVVRLSRARRRTGRRRTLDAEHLAFGKKPA